MLAEVRLLSRARLEGGRHDDPTATSKEKEVKLKHRVLVSTPDQRTGQNQCAHVDSMFYIFTSRARHICTLCVY